MGSPRPSKGHHIPLCGDCRPILYSEKKIFRVSGGQRFSVLARVERLKALVSPLYGLLARSAQQALSDGLFLLGDLFMVGTTSSTRSDCESQMSRVVIVLTGRLQPPTAGATAPLYSKVRSPISPRGSLGSMKASPANLLATLRDRDKDKERGDREKQIDRAAAEDGPMPERLPLVRHERSATLRNMVLTGYGEGCTPKRLDEYECWGLLFKRRGGMGRILGWKPRLFTLYRGESLCILRHLPAERRGPHPLKSRSSRNASAKGCLDH